MDILLTNSIAEVRAWLTPSEALDLHEVNCRCEIEWLDSDYTSIFSFGLVA